MRGKKLAVLQGLVSLALCAGIAPISNAAAKTIVLSEPPSPTVKMPIWVGYVWNRPNGQYTRIAARLRVPKPECGWSNDQQGTKTGLWVGLGGFSPQAVGQRNGPTDGSDASVLEQTGIQMTCPPVGRPQIQAFWEIYPNPPRLLPYYPQPGQTISMSVESDGQRTVHGQGWVRFRLQMGSYAPIETWVRGSNRHSAEAIVEQPIENTSKFVLSSRWFSPTPFDSTAFSQLYSPGSGQTYELESNGGGENRITVSYNGSKLSLNTACEPPWAPVPCNQ